MSVVSPLFDASIAGSLAGASLCASRAAKTLEMGEFATDPAAPCAAARDDRRTKWRALLDTILDPISGPTLPRREA